MARPLDPVSLRLFVAVCENGSMARAAEREALVSSALSKRIAALEAELGVPLLVRRRRGVEPTPAGETLLRQAREVLGAMERMCAEIRDFGAGAQGNVRVLASPSALAARLPADIASFMAEFPSVRVTLDERVTPDLVRNVREGAADLSVLWDRADLSGLRAVPYRDDRLCVAMPRSHSLARRRSLRFDEALDKITIGVATGGLLDTMLRRQAGLSGRLPEYRIQVSGIDAACQLVGAGLGLAIMPHAGAALHADARQLRLVPLSDAWAARRIVICTRPEPLLSATARRLVEHLRVQALSA